MRPLPPPSRLLAQLRTPALWAFAIKGANAVLSFGVTVLIARLGGASVVGAYALATSTMLLLGLVGLRGQDQVALRAVAGDLREGHTGRARAALDWSVRLVALSGVAAGVAMALGVWLTPLAGWLEADPAMLLLAAGGVAVMGLFRLGQAGLRALGFPILGQAADALPTLLLLLALGALALAGRPVEALVAVGLFIAAKGLTSLWSFHRIRRAKRGWAAAAPIDPSALQRAGVTVMGTAILHQFANWFLLTAITGQVGAAEAGAFRVAFQIISLIIIVTATAETYVAPRLAGDLRIGRPDLAWRRHWRATALMLALSAPVFAAAIFFPAPLLGAFFGAEFAIAAPALTVMTIGQAANVLTGPVGMLMVMAGHERTQLWVATGGTVVLIGLALWLIPLLGILGAAIAWSVVIAGRNCVTFALARRLVR